MTENNDESFIHVPANAGASFTEQVFMALLRELIDTSRSTNLAVTAMQGTMTDVVSRLSLIEGNDVERRLTATIARLEKLEEERQRRVGAAALAVWFKDFAPWIVAILFGLWVVFSRPPSPLG